LSNRRHGLRRGGQRAPRTIGLDPRNPRALRVRALCERSRQLRALALLRARFYSRIDAGVFDAEGRGRQEPSVLIPGIRALSLSALSARDRDSSARSRYSAPASTLESTPGSSTRRAEG